MKHFCPGRFHVPSGDIQHLLSLPPGSAAWCARSGFRKALGLFVTSDPPGTQLGSGGGTAYLLDAAHRASRAGCSFKEWLAASRKLLIHGSGESRRLPGYAVIGKPLVPLPRLPGRPGQHPDQRLLDLQVECYDRLFWHAPQRYRVMVACGDVLVAYDGALPPLPEADVLIAGLRSTPEEAQHHGVMFCSREPAGHMNFFLQKPTPEEIRSLSATHEFYLDTGAWMLSRRAVEVLLEKTDREEGAGAFAGGAPQRYELYSRFGLSLGDAPREHDPAISALSCAVMPLPQGRFYHFGSGRSLLVSVRELRRPAAERHAFGHDSWGEGSAAIILGSSGCPAAGIDAPNVWIDNCSLPDKPRWTGNHILTNLVDANWVAALGTGVCLDAVPLSASDWCLRPYGIDDAFRGALGEPGTEWMGRPAAAWFARRGIALVEAGLSPGDDIQAAAMFPVVSYGAADPAFVEWLVAETPGAGEPFRRQWLEGPRHSARSLLAEAAPGVLLDRPGRRLESAPPEETYAATDLKALAAMGEEASPSEGEASRPSSPSMVDVHARMYRATLEHGRDEATARQWENEAFASLRDLIVERLKVDPVRPACTLAEDQIVWGRSPVRLDLAGGWTDTPPYCLEFGGSVVNVAVDLNGQPPIQVFVRVTDKPKITIRSIDLGVHEEVGAYEALQEPGQLGSGFGIVKCALALSGLAPPFHAGTGYGSLREQLEAEVGGGLELTTLAAVPKGSGLGTSSILAATVLGTLGEVLGLAWDSSVLFQRTLALEQLLGSGGGWQDQVGGAVPGLKWIETRPGLAQAPEIHWLPDRLLGPDSANRRCLLYYTGLTRTAHDVLAEIVRGMFLSDRRRLAVLEEIGWNAAYAARAIQRNAWQEMCEVVRRSWQLNQRLDEDTNPPAVQATVDAAGDGLAACKLLGAGGGGYMLMLARDVDAGEEIRQRLTANPPNPRARFVDMRVSDTGFQVTRS